MVDEQFVGFGNGGSGGGNVIVQVVDVPLQRVVGRVGFVVTGLNVEHNFQAVLGVFEQVLLVSQFLDLGLVGLVELGQFGGADGGS